MNYICHLLAVRKDVAERAGSYQSAFDGAQDLDFILRCSEQAQKDLSCAEDSVSLALPYGLDRIQSGEQALCV